MASLQWISTEMRTGRVIADLPDLGVDELAQTLGRYESVTATLPLPTAPENWDRATLEGAATLILLQDDVPIGGGFVSKRGRDEGDVLSLSLMTLEGLALTLFGGHLERENVHYGKQTSGVHS